MNTMKRVTSIYRLYLDAEYVVDTDKIYTCAFCRNIPLMILNNLSIIYNCNRIKAVAFIQEQQK